MNSKNLFNKQLIQYECLIYPQELNDNINDIIVAKATKMLVNKCSGYGFIKQILRIHKKNDNIITNDSFVLFNVTLEVLICNPQIGDNIECVITNKDERIGRPMMKKEPLLVVIFSNKEHQIGETITGIITDKRINKTNNMINLLIDVI